MKFRWSNEHNFSIEFESTQNDFSDVANNALIKFQHETKKKYHDGKTGKNMVRIREAVLHVLVYDKWFSLVDIGKTESGSAYFEQNDLRVFGLLIENSDHDWSKHRARQLAELRKHEKEILLKIENAFRQAAAMENLILDIEWTIRNMQE